MASLQLRANGKPRASTYSSKTAAMDYELNIRVMLSTFFHGQGGCETALYASFLGIPYGKSLERTFHRHSDLFHRNMLDLCGSIIRDALTKEVTATINEKMSSKFIDKEIKQNITHFLDKDYYIMDASILTIRIIISYDMGW